VEIKAKFYEEKMVNKKSYWITERNNPQFKEPYYIACGQLSKTEAKKRANPLYGYNRMIEFLTEEEYHNALEKYEREGKSVHK
jgi:hypothetical protein